VQRMEIWQGAPPPFSSEHIFKFFSQTNPNSLTSNALWCFLLEPLRLRRTRVDCVMSIRTETGTASFMLRYRVKYLQGPKTSRNCCDAGHSSTSRHAQHTHSHQREWKSTPKNKTSVISTSNVLYLSYVRKRPAIQTQVKDDRIPRTGSRICNACKFRHCMPRKRTCQDSNTP
jgi:hypothetical protein